MANRAKFNLSASIIAQGEEFVLVMEDVNALGVSQEEYVKYMCLARKIARVNCKDCARLMELVCVIKGFMELVAKVQIRRVKS